jgi:hypothetical protein
MFRWPRGTVGATLESMALIYHDLDEATRQLMLQEMAADVLRGTVQLSKWLTSAGRNHWVELLSRAIENGDDVALACELRRHGYVRQYQICHRNGRPYQARVPHTAPDTLAEGDFNHYYCRAICRRSLDEGKGVVEVYRAKAVSEPRPRSQQMLGALVDAQRLLDDLRTHPGGIDAALGIPSGPNSGLSVRLPKYRQNVKPGRESMG